MKIMQSIAAVGLLMSTATIAPAAQAQEYRSGHGYGYDNGHRGDAYHEGGYRDDRYERGNERRDDRYEREYRHDNGNHYGWNRNRRSSYNNVRRCWVEYRHHRQYRVCR